MLTFEIDDDRLYSVGEVSKITKLCTRSIQKCCNKGLLTAIYKPPHLSHRWIMGSDIKRFVVEHGMTHVVSGRPLKDRLVESLRDFVKESDWREYDGEAIQRARVLLAEIDGEKAKC